MASDFVHKIPVGEVVVETCGTEKNTDKFIEQAMPNIIVININC